MLSTRAVGRLLAGSVVTAASAMTGGGTTAAVVADDAATITTYTATVRVNEDGTLGVEELATYDFAGNATAQVTRVLTTREHYDADSDRQFDVSDVSVDAGPTDVESTVRTNEEDTEITVEFAEEQSGTVTVRFGYVVDGAVARTVDGTEVRWPVVQGFDVPVYDVTVHWNAPDVLWVACLAGSPGSSRPCTTAQTAETPNPVMTQDSLGPGQQLVGVLGLDTASGVAPTADLVQRWSLERAFTASGAPLWVALGVLALGLLAAVGLWWTRGRDVGGSVPSGPAAPFIEQSGRLVFAPPNAVRPGQMGTLVDERADVIDVSSTVIDLAVRNYLFVEELPHGEYGRHDWLLRRRHEGGDELLGYEREVLSAVFEAGDEVRVSELGESLRSRLPAVRAALYDDVVSQGWFAERPDAVRNRWTTAGWVLVVAGVVLTGVLAVASRFGLVGLAVVVAGVALVAAGLAAPARTARGSHALEELRHFRAFLADGGLDDMPAGQREELASRCYPYALVFGLGERWAVAIAGLDEDDEPDEPLHWYGAPQNWHLSDAAPSLIHLSTALGGAIASRRLLGD
jgi:uncharacterized protein (TIGR04222 family)